MHYRIKQNKVKKITVILLWLLLIGICISHNRKSGKEEESTSVRVSAVRFMEERVLACQMPLASFVNQERAEANIWEWFFDMAAKRLPFYDYGEENYGYPIQTESKSTYALLIEREEGRDEDNGRMEDAVSPDESMASALLMENEQAKTQEMVKENEAVIQEQGIFIPASQKSLEFNFDDYKEFDALLGGFYAIDSTTGIGPDQLNVDALLQKDMTISQDNSKPQILIYHTHSQESFADSVPGDASTTIMGAGEKLANLLSEQYGFNVLYHRGQYDVEARDYAYSKAEPALEQILAENPSIEVIIDLHRDEVAADRKLVMDLNGRPTATFMFFNGLSRTKQRGDIEYLYNPYINDNLAFSFQMQVASNEYYPGITRRIYLKGYRYNMHYRPKSLLIELGAQTNTVEEIMNACDPLAHVIAMVLNGEAP